MRERAVARRALGAFVACLVLSALAARAQEGAKKASLLRDPEDGAFDVGGWIATRTGVLPVPSIITEPAVGYGGAFALVLIHGGGLAGLRDAPPGVTGKRVTPDVSAAGGALTENGTWAAFAAHAGFWRGDRWRYLGAAGRMSPRLDTYDAAGRAYGFQLDGWFVVQEIKRRVGLTDLFLGARYVFLDNRTTFDLDALPPGVARSDRATRDSGLGLVAEYDTKDNQFTPTSGYHVKTAATFLGSYVGGDRDYQRYSLDGSGYWHTTPRLVLAARIRTQNVGGDAPFYARPWIVLRGVPSMRYQGETAVSADAEARFGVTNRWWLVAFTGAGWTDAGSVRALKNESVTASGFGFRYLLARVLGIQAGVDVAKGPEQWVFYVVFGSSI